MPPPVVSNLTSDQSFDVESASQTARYDLGTDTTQASQSAASRIQIDYSAADGSYTITIPGLRSTVFTPSDEINAADPTRREFKTNNGNESEALTLAYSNFGSNLETDSVALGFWQRTNVNGSLQDSEYDVFVYGFPTSASNVPTTGSADFRTDVFGFSSQVGSEPLSFQGTGNTVFDFARGTFSMDTNISESFLFTGAGRFGALYLRASGNIASAANGFSGTFAFDGSGNTVFGDLYGAFFGEDGSEAGGTFSGDDGAGNSVVGGFTALSQGPSASNLSVYNLTADELFYTGQANYEQRRYKDGSLGFVSARVGSNGQVSYDATDQSYRVAGFVEAEGRFRPSDIVSAAGSEFDVYRINAGAEDIELAIYQPADGGEIELTYSGFGVYRRTFEDANQFNFRQDWFLYGLDTPEGVLAGRTGTGTYNGVVRGVAGSRDGKRELGVTGSSQFLIDFATSGYAGWLRLLGTDKADGSQVDFGEFTLAEGTYGTRNAFQTALRQNGGDVGEIQLRFFGPTGEELAGVFGIGLNDYGIVGGTAAVRE